jgi:ubiquinone/menaquinone biosynthesis C-methylase UbiE/DNA-binding transcriptional ArsR family regulator
MYMLGASGLFRLLGDDARLRILRLLAAERLNVSELTTILGIAQSGVSRHLGLLREAGLVREHRDGGFSYYGLMDQPGGKLDNVWPFVRSQLAAELSGPGQELGSTVLRDDDARLREVTRQRREHRESHGAIGNGGGRQLVPGRSWAAWSRALGLLLPNLTVADLGCGDGHLTLEMAVWARRVFGVDHSATVLRRARELSRRREVTNVSWKRGALEKVPLETGSVDVVVLSHALHHAAEPGRALTEATRVVAEDGRVLILDLDEHDQEWVTSQLGDRWLSFDRPTLSRMMKSAGLQDIRVGSGLEESPFGVVVAVGTKRSPGGRRRRRRAETR